MSSLRFATAANVRAFSDLTEALATSDGKFSNSIDYEGLQDEIGRFRVWSGNLGALQKGHSSLDYRLRDSPLLSSNALKFLNELETNIKEAYAIVTEARLPYELQPKPEEDDDDENNDDGFFDEEEPEEDEGVGSRTELEMRLFEITDIIANLYKISLRIRTPTIRSTYKPKDAETGDELMNAYARYDVHHVREVIRQLRQPHQEEVESDQDYLIDRLSYGITLRRRHFKYWKRHRDKLATVQEECTTNPRIGRPELPVRNDTNDTLDVLPDVPILVTSQEQEAPSQRTGKTLLSGTEATNHHQSLDEIVDTKSVTSYAVTVRDLTGKGVNLPPPPRAADGEKDFECPYCYIICPARYGRGRGWKNHLLQDLQPYCCTYPECDRSEQLFRSRRDWREHEASHRKVWRCPEHPSAIYKSASRLEDHFRREHADSIPENQLQTIVKVGETTTIDLRAQCPICHASADMDGLGDFHNHIANHLERLATFALPNLNEDESEGASSAASHGRTESSHSQDIGTLSLPSNTTDNSNAVDRQESTEGMHRQSIEVGHVEWQAQEVTAGATLSAESLNQVPDARQSRLETLFASPPEVQNEPSDPHRPDDSDSDSSQRNPSDVFPNTEGSTVTKAAGLPLADIPTIRALYRSRRLLQRDQSFAPNDAYNQVISFCYHDITKLKVDAIVNSANKALKVTRRKSLNNDIQRAAGPELAQETRSIRRLKDEAVLTGGYRLPSEHIIHVPRPGFWGARGTRDFKQLTDCYRNVFKVAVDHQLKTIAFPCLGTGGTGFPARVAARTILQYIREYLDEHKEYKFERIVFCVNTPADEKAYIDFLPVYFPPTHSDLDVARSSVWSEDRAAVAAQVLETRQEMQKIQKELNLSLTLSVPDFPKDLLGHFSAIDHALASIRRFLLWSKEVSQNLRDLRLICSVMQIVCGTVTEVISLAKDRGGQGQRDDKLAWDDYVSDMQARHGTSPSDFLRACREFAESLDNAITKDGVAFDHVIGMIDTRPKLERFKVKQRVGRDAEGTQDHLNEVLYTREFQRDTVLAAAAVGGASSASKLATIKIQNIPSIAQLYKLGELDEKSTFASPSTLFNNQVCLVREDITKIEVDVLVNSTDASFEGIGTLARSVFLRGGEELRNAVKIIGKVDEGDIRLTEGYLLPAKHILHVVPPGQFRHDTKDMMRKIYRNVLHSAVNLRATSIAIPCIGTGLLNYPRRDSVSLALEEVKRFLESAVPESLIQKIIFVVFSSNDEFVFRSLLPVYFPPPDLKANLAALRKAIPRQDTDTSTASGSSEKPKKTIFGSIGEAFRSLRSSKTSDTSRPLTTNEEHALIEFESHAKDCDICRGVSKLYIEGRDLCKDGYGLASKVLSYMEMHTDQKVYTKADSKGQSIEIDIPADMFSITMELLATVEKSYRGEHRGRPFVSVDRPYAAITQDQAQEAGAAGVVDDDALFRLVTKRARAYVFTKAGFAEEWTPVSPLECQIGVLSDNLKIVESHAEDARREPLMSLKLHPSTVVDRRMTTPEVTLAGTTRLESRLRTEGDILFRCRSDHECNSLLRMIRRTLEGLQAAPQASKEQETSAAPAESVRNTSTEYLEWNKRLQDIRSELGSVKRASGGLSDLQYKMDRLSAAASDLNKESDVSKLYDTTRSPLATRVLLCLTADLKTRPGSYIGLKTDRLISELRTTLPQLRVALEELVVAGEVHTTVDDDTWVISDPPKDLPVLPAEQLDTATREADGVEDQPVSSVRFAEDIESVIPPAHAAEPDTHATANAALPSIWDDDGIPVSPIALWITSYYLYDPPTLGDAAWNQDIARRLGTTVYAIENALTEFRQKTRFYGNLGPIEDSYLMPGILVACYYDEDYIKTCISRDLVYPEVLQENGVEFEFEKHGDALVLRRRLEKGELMQWNTRSIEIKRAHNKSGSALRKGLGQYPKSKGKGKERAREPEHASEDSAKEERDEEKEREGPEASTTAADRSAPASDDPLPPNSLESNVASEASPGETQAYDTAGDPRRQWHQNFSDGASEQEIVRARQRQFMQQQFPDQQEENVEKNPNSPASSIDAPQQDQPDPSTVPSIWQCSFCDYMNPGINLLCGGCAGVHLNYSIEDAEQVVTGNAMETYEQAMVWLNLTHDESDDSIITMASIKVADDPASIELARKAVSLIAEHRDSDRLRRYSGMRVPRTSTPVDNPEAAETSASTPAEPPNQIVPASPSGTRPSTPPAEPTPSGDYHTHLEKEYYDVRVLVEAGEKFDDEGQLFRVHRKVDKKELESWLLRSQEVRAKDEG